ncbi:MAG: hypothetical protein WKF37_11730 [Bryobacteraceae bacterium]
MDHVLGCDSKKRKFAKPYFSGIHLELKATAFPLVAAAAKRHDQIFQLQREFPLARWDLLATDAFDAAELRASEPAA